MFIIVTACLVVSVTIWAISFLIQRSNGIRPPPGPCPFPIIGNIHQLGRNPHRSLAQLSKTYGPLMSVKAGSLNIVVVSSPEMAKEMYTKHDQAISGRPTATAFKVCDHDKYSIATLPAGTEWRRFRKICKEQLFSTSKLDSGKHLRQEKLQELYEYVKDSCNSSRAVNIEEVVFTTTLNLMSVTLFSMDLGDLGSDSIRQLRAAVSDLFDTVSAPNLADFFPVLEVIDPQGIKRRGERSVGKLLAILDEVIQQRLLSTSSEGSPRKNDMLDALLDPKKGKDYDIRNNDIKHLLLDLLAAGADSVSSTVVWIMTELLLNTNKMAILADELRTVIGEDKQIQESDIARLPYLRATIKEGLRFHPPEPFLLPRKAEVDIQVNGYMIRKDTQIITNVWCMGRDSSIWPHPNSFEPERFLASNNIDFWGKHFELIPFGSGRRTCPGMPLADRMLHLTVAFFIYNFDWKLEPGYQLDATEKFGISLKKKIPLKAVPTNPLFPSPTS